MSCPHLQDDSVSKEYKEIIGNWEARIGAQHGLTGIRGLKPFKSHNIFTDFLHIPVGLFRASIISAAFFPHLYHIFKCSA
jgi:hypothetical protein